MKVWHPWQFRKSKSWGPFWSYQLNSTANSAHFAQFLCNGPNWQCCSAGSSKTAPRILIFFNCPVYWVFILCEIHCCLCPPKSWHNNSSLGSVCTEEPYASFLCEWQKKLPSTDIFEWKSMSEMFRWFLNLKIKSYILALCKD